MTQHEKRQLDAKQAKAINNFLTKSIKPIGLFVIGAMIVLYILYVLDNEFHNMFF